MWLWGETLRSKSCRRWLEALSRLLWKSLCLRCSSCQCLRHKRRIGQAWGGMRRYLISLRLWKSSYLVLRSVTKKMQATNSRFRGLRATIEQFQGSEAKETEGKGKASLCERLLFGGGGRVWGQFLGTAAAGIQMHVKLSPYEILCEWHRCDTANWLARAHRHMWKVSFPSCPRIDRKNIKMNAPNNPVFCIGV